MLFLATVSNRAFMIHASQDLRFVRQLRADLLRHGIEALTSENLITPGREFATQLERFIRVTPVILVVWSGAAAARSWVATEISLALSQQLSGEPKLLIPVLAESGVELPFFIRNLQYLDLSSSATYRDGVERLAEAIRSWRASDEPRAEVDRSRLRLIEAERLALEVQRQKATSWNNERFTLLVSALATLTAALAALFVGSVGAGLLKLDWVAPTLLYGFAAGAVSGAVSAALFIAFRRRSRALMRRRRE